jgi:flagellar motor protein MotB
MNQQLSQDRAQAVIANLIQDCILSHKHREGREAHVFTPGKTPRAGRPP